MKCQQAAKQGDDLVFSDVAGTLHTRQGLIRCTGHQLLDHQILGGLVLEGDGLRIVGVDLHGLGLGVGVNDIAGDRLDLLYNHSTYDAQDPSVFA